MHWPFRCALNKIYVNSSGITTNRNVRRPPAILIRANQPQGSVRCKLNILSNYVYDKRKYNGNVYVLGLGLIYRSDRTEMECEISTDIIAAVEYQRVRCSN